MLSRIFSHWSRRKRAANPITPALPRFDLERPILRIGHDEWTIRDACEHVAIFGAPGSGKSSGSMKFLIRQYFREGFGALMLTVKPDDADDYVAYAQETGRQKSVVRITPTSGHRFNFLDYELRRKGGSTNNLAVLFTTILQTANREKVASTGDSKYWEEAARELFTHTIELLFAARDKLTIDEICQVIATAPKSQDEADSDDFYRWQENPEANFCAMCMDIGDRKLGRAPSRVNFDVAVEFFRHEHCRIPERTRESIVSVVRNMSFHFRREPLRSLFATDTNFTPEVAFDGVILIVDFPIKVHDQIGLYVNGILKFLFQKAAERRPTHPHMRPACLIADEAQYTVNSYDILFMSTSRSARTPCIMASQNLANFHHQLGGGDQARAFTESLLGTLQTLIAHQNTDTESNRWLSERVGKRFIKRQSSSSSFAEGGKDKPEGSFSFSTNENWSEEYIVPPTVFPTLRKGAPRNQYEVEAIFYPGGRVLSSGEPYAKITFNQKS